MTWPIVELTFWSPGDSSSVAIDRMLLDATAPLAKHGLTGVAAAYARETGAEIHEVHRGWIAHLAGRSLGVDGALRDVVSLLDSAQLPFFVAKGPVLAHTLYSDPSLRHYCDLDVYVPAGHHARARRLLIEGDYRPVDHTAGVLGGLAQELHGGRFGATVELHAHVVDNLHRHHLPAVDAFLVHVRHEDVAGVKVPILDAGAHIALQAIHAAAGHRYAKLILLRDVQLGLSATNAAIPSSLGADAYLHAMTGVLIGLGSDIQRTAPAGTLAPALVGRMLAEDPASWDEYRLSFTNVVALLNQRSWRTSLSSGLHAARGVLPRRNRRVAVRAPIASPATSYITSRRSSS